MTPSGLVVSSELHTPAEQRAADFVQRRRFWEWSDSDQAELDAWLAESVANRVAWLRIEGGVARAGELAALDVSEQRAPARGMHRRFLLRCFAASEDHAQTRRSHLRRRVVLPLLAAASIALVVAVGLPFVRGLLQPPPDRIFGTNVGGRALLKFSDGTEVELNTDTAVRYRMTSRERTVWLDKGEAYFRVAHNAANPFAVVSGGHRVTDLGTEFLVRNDADGLDVALVRGRAQLASENPGVPVAMLSPGDEAIATKIATTLTKKTQQELADELAWRRGMLVFRNTKLADAAREFNRYNETKLVIADPSVADLRFSAEIATDRYEDFLQLAQTVLKLRVDREGNEILISRGLRERTGKAVRDKHGH